MAHQYIISFAPWVGTNAENGALIKPKRDIIQSLKELGFQEPVSLEDLHYNKAISCMFPGKRDFIGRFKRKFLLPKWKLKWIRENIRSYDAILNNIKENDVVCLQYPINGDHSPELYDYFVQKIPTLKCTTIVIVHDLESIDRGYKYLDTEKEFHFIKSFKHVILHNKAMIDLLHKIGDTCRYYSLGIFDYIINDEASAESTPIENSVFFPGNMHKAAFLQEINPVNKWNFHFYGNYDKSKKYPSNLVFHGMVSAQEVIKEGGKYAWGLVWDGDRIDSLHGQFGEYMKINNPYKFSCNIVSGLPIITSSQAGIAPFVLEHKLGIVLDSLLDLNNMVMTEENYSVFKENVLKWRHKIMQGGRVKELVLSIIQNQKVLS